jgi:serine/threonine protein kinase
VNEVVELIEGIINGLRAMHRKETLHGDLKPDNIMIDPEGLPRIIDFGSAYIVGIREIDLPFERDFALGTERYSAPEYKLGRKLTLRADLFSLAMIAYEERCCQLRKKSAAGVTVAELDLFSNRPVP